MFFAASMKAFPLRPAAIAVLLAVSFGSSGPVYAEGPYSLDREVKKVGGWTIAVNKQRHGCLAFGEFRSGTAVELGYDTKKDAGFLVFANQDWDFVTNGADYDVRLVFNGNNRWRAHAKGAEMGRLHAFVFEGVKGQFIIDFAAYSSVRLEIEGVKLEGISLNGTMDAVKAMIDCSQYVSGQ
jgi:hypothetical protein